MQMLQVMSLGHNIEVHYFVFSFKHNEEVFYIAAGSTSLFIDMCTSNCVFAHIYVKITILL